MAKGCFLDVTLSQNILFSFSFISLEFSECNCHRRRRVVAQILLAHHSSFLESCWFQCFMHLVNAAALALNAILDWIFASKFYLGAEGLVPDLYPFLEDNQVDMIFLTYSVLNCCLRLCYKALSTSFTTALSVLILYYFLRRRLAGLLDFAELFFPIM